MCGSCARSDYFFYHFYSIIIRIFVFMNAQCVFSKGVCVCVEVCVCRGVCVWVCLCVYSHPSYVDYCPQANISDHYILVLGLS